MTFNTPQETASEISTRISLLCDMSDADLKLEMQNLKTALKENPAAVSLMHDEDVGKMVVALRRITGFAIAQASAKEKKPRAVKEKSKPLTAAELAAALDDDDF